MYFKVDQKSELHQKLEALFQKQIEVGEATSAFIDKLNKQTGDDNTRAYLSMDCFGGFTYKVFNDILKVPPGWVKAKFNSLAFAPSRANKFKKHTASILAEIDALPTLPYKEFADVVNYGMYSGPARGTGMAISQYPSILPSVPYLIKTAEFVTLKQYTPVDGMIEITASEFESIKSTIASNPVKK